jgi:hypothetical protein
VTSTAAVAGRLLRLTLAGDRTRLVIGLGMLLAAAGAGLLQPWPLKLVVDSVLGGVPRRCLSRRAWPSWSSSAWR